MGLQPQLGLGLGLCQTKASLRSSKRPRSLCSNRLVPELKLNVGVRPVPDYVSPGGRAEEPDSVIDDGFGVLGEVGRNQYIHLIK